MLPDAKQVGPILIVEDDYLVALQAQGALAEAGFELLDVATSAEEAIRLAGNGKAGLVVMDVRLAGRRDGVDAAIELYRDHGIRCIFASAHYDPITKNRAEAAMPLGWLEKPYSAASLVAMVRRGLQELETRA
jgi:DNA-binding NarL/FixJ family response regulator